MTPRASILLPVHNAETTLSPCLESIRKQTVANWELIVVADGCTDSSVDLVSSRFQQDARLRLLRQDPCGIASSLNRAAHEARSPLLVRMDADDVMAPDRLERQLTYMSLHPHTDLLASCVTFAGKRDDQRGYAEYVDWTNRLVDAAQLRANRFVESPLVHPSVTIRRDSFWRWGGYSEDSLPEDYELWLRAWDQGAVIEKLPRHLLEWTDHPDRISRNHPNYDSAAFYRVKCRYLARWLERNNPFHPNITLWGAGRLTRNRFAPLLRAGVQISRYIDIHPRKIGNAIDGIPVHHPDTLNLQKEFLVSGVASRGARAKILAYLLERKWEPESHFLLAA